MKKRTKLKKTSDNIFKEAFGSWKDAGIKDSVKWVKDVRKGWEKRRKRLGL